MCEPPAESLIPALAPAHPGLSFALTAPPACYSPVQLDPDTGVFKADPRLSFAHPYPTTKIMFSPEKVG